MTSWRILPRVWTWTLDDLNAHLPFGMTVTRDQLCIVGGVLGMAVLVKAAIKVSTARHYIGESLEGKVVLITGGTAGIGKETARALAKQGATVHIIADRLRRGVQAVVDMKQSTGNQEIYLHPVDLCDLSSVRKFAEEFLATESPIHILINNACLTGPERVITMDGLERTMQVNHFSHFLLTNLLLDRILESAPSRIVNVSSHMHQYAKNFDVHDLRFKRTEYYQMSGFMAYAWSKLANILFTRELARRVYGKGVMVNACHPGAVRTDALRNYSFFNPAVLSIILRKPFYKSAFDGAQTSLYLATSDDVANISGQYFAECKLALPSIKAVDDWLAEELWRESEKATYKIDEAAILVHPEETTDSEAS